VGDHLRVVWDGGEVVASADESPIIVGRDVQARVRLTNRTVSRTHIHVVLRDGTWVAVDRSRRGTYGADGTPIAQVAIGHEQVELHLASPDGPAVRFAAAPTGSGGPLPLPSAPPAPTARGSLLVPWSMTAADVAAGLVDLTGRWTRRRVTSLLVTALVAAAVSYAVNLWVVARHYEGPTFVPAGAPVTVGPDRTQALVLWFVLSAIGGAMAAQLVVIGPRAVADKIVSLPARLRAVPAAIGETWVPVAMVGTAVTIVVGGLVIPALRGTVGFAILAFLPFAIGRAASAAAGPLAVAITTRAGRPTTQGSAVAGTGLAGAGAGLVIGSVISSLVIRLVLAAALVAVVVVRGRRVRPALTFVVLLAGGLVIVDWLTAGAAHADDGGWIECGSNWSDFTGCTGTDPVFDGARDGGIAGACGGACGNVLGGSDGGKPPPADAPCVV
jgi:hypothetical protein